MTMRRVKCSKCGGGGLVNWPDGGGEYLCETCGGGVCDLCGVLLNSEESNDWYDYGTRFCVYCTDHRGENIADLIAELQELHHQELQLAMDEDSSESSSESSMSETSLSSMSSTSESSLSSLSESSTNPPMSNRLQKPTTPLPPANIPKIQPNLPRKFKLQ